MSRAPGMQSGSRKGEFAIQNVAAASVAWICGQKELVWLQIAKQ